MKRHWLIAATVMMGLVTSPLWAQTASAKVQVWDRGATTSIAGPGAPAHVVGLPRTMHDISLNTGVKTYGLRYVVSTDPKEPLRAIPGEGYIGMPQPTDANWYGGGFFDLKLNGKSIGPTLVKVFTGRAVSDRGYVDYVFDDPQAVVRLRFVALAGKDCLYAQLLLEPKVEVKQASVSLRCYPSGFVSRSNGSERHVLTPVRDLRAGAGGALDVSTEYWLNYYDAVYDQGAIRPAATGLGGCSALWVPSQISEGAVSVGDYAVETTLQLKPVLRDFRFIFFDHAGTPNAAAQAALRAGAPQLLAQLATMVFADSSVTEWPLAEKLTETRRLLAALPGDEAQAARYSEWQRELETQLPLVKRSGGQGAIMAEAAALKTVTEWDKSLPELRLQALLATF
ncbi:MAG: hypothetical protein ABFD94_19440 [Armatimonadia bacterium]